MSPAILVSLRSREGPWTADWLDWAEFLSVWREWRWTSKGGLWAWFSCCILGCTPGEIGSKCLAHNWWRRRGGRTIGERRRWSFGTSVERLRSGGGVMAVQQTNPTCRLGIRYFISKCNVLFLVNRTNGALFAWEKGAKKTNISYSYTNQQTSDHRISFDRKCRLHVKLWQNESLTTIWTFR